MMYQMFDRCKRTHGDQKLRGADVVAKGYPFKKDRDVSVQNFPVVLDPQGGPYVIIPMTYDPGADLKFYCTVRANKHIKLEEYSVPTQVCARVWNNILMKRMTHTEKKSDKKR